MGLVLTGNPGGDTLRGGHLACQGAAQSVFKGRRANFLRPLCELRLSRSPELKHAVSAEARKHRQPPPFLQRPPPPCTRHSKRWGHPSPIYATQLLPEAQSTPSCHLSLFWTWPKDGP